MLGYLCLIFAVSFFLASGAQVHRYGDDDDGQDRGDRGGDTCQLKMLFVVFRHGSRTPVVLFPNDPHNVNWTKTCLGELTNVGKSEQLINGKLTKDRYAQFIGDHYSCSEFNAQSTTVPRAVMSGNCFLSGLYPPKHSDVWSSEPIAMYYQPIPLYTIIPQAWTNNNILVFPNSSTVQTWPPYIKHKKTLDAMAEAVGLTPGADIYPLFMLIDALICEDYLNWPLPFGMDKYRDQLMPILGDLFNYAIKDSSVVVAGPMLSEMVSAYEALRSGHSVVKTQVYSLHDLHVLALMKALVNEDIGEPPFSSTMYLEVCVRSKPYPREFVKLYYRPNVYTQPKLYKIKGCDSECPFERFSNLAKVVLAQSTAYGS